MIIDLDKVDLDSISLALTSIIARQMRLHPRAAALPPEERYAICTEAARTAAAALPAILRTEEEE